MKILAMVAFTLTMGLGGLVHAADVAGVRIDPVARVGNAELAINGAGLRQRFKTDIYIISLYFKEAKLSAAAAIDHYGPKRIALRLMRDVTAQALVDALYEGIRDNTTATELARLKPSADALAAAMLPLKLAKKGDIVALDYLPDTGSQIVVNGRPVGPAIPGHDLYRALLKIWLGDSPVDPTLKRALLAGLVSNKP